jgi:hypothetical protein
MPNYIVKLTVVVVADNHGAAVAKVQRAIDDAPASHAYVESIDKVEQEKR